MAKKPNGWTETRVGAVRLRLDVSREALTRLFGVAPSTLLRWETCPEGHRPYGLQLAVLKLLERAIEGGQVAACEEAVALAQTDLPAALWLLLLASRAKEAA